MMLMVTIGAAHNRSHGLGALNPTRVPDRRLVPSPYPAVSDVSGAAHVAICKRPSLRVVNRVPMSACTFMSWYLAQV